MIWKIFFTNFLSSQENRAVLIMHVNDLTISTAKWRREENYLRLKNIQIINIRWCHSTSEWEGTWVVEQQSRVILKSGWKIFVLQAIKVLQHFLLILSASLFLFTHIFSEKWKKIMKLLNYGMSQLVTAQGVRSNNNFLRTRNFV
jgi:hypothetical protein